MLKELADSPRSLLYAVLVHIVLLGLLVVSLELTSPPMPVAPTVNVVQARVVDDSKRREEQQRKEEELRQAESRRQAEQGQKEQRRREEEQRQTQIKRQEEQQRKEAEQRSLEEKRQAEQLKQRQEQERQRAEAQKRKAEEDSRRAEEEEMRRLQMAEEQDMIRAEQERRLASEIDKYRMLIAQKVERNWLRPAGAKSGMSCTVKVRLAPGGHVMEAQVVKTCGDTAVDHTVEAAVNMASPLPVPADPQLFERMREINFIFKPKQ